MNEISLFRRCEVSVEVDDWHGCRCRLPTPGSEFLASIFNVTVVNTPWAIKGEAISQVVLLVHIHPLIQYYVATLWPTSYISSIMALSLHPKRDPKIRAD